MKKFIISCPLIYKNDQSESLISDGAVLIENGTILSIGKRDEIVKANPEKREERFNHGLLTPGLVNIHHHLYSSFARGWLPQGARPRNFEEILKQIWWKLDEGLTLDGIYYSAILGLCDCMRSGVTSVADHHSSPLISTSALEMIGDAFNLVGIRGSICLELTNRAGEKAFESGLKETIRALSRWPLDAKSNRLSSMVGLHASMTLSDDNLLEIANATRIYSPGYHFHLAEDKIDQEISIMKFGEKATKRFEKFGLLNNRSLAVHGIHLDLEEISMLKTNGTKLAICPCSNLNNAVGIAPWWTYGDLSIGLGTDGIGSDIINEAKTALYMAHHNLKDPSFGHDRIQNMLLENNSAIFNAISGMKIGKISPGYQADLVLWPYISPTPINVNNILSHYLYGLSQVQADSVWVAGEQLLSGSNFINLDYSNLLEEFNIQSRLLWERI
jgi:putative selenium metabolism protein SsnA